MSWRRGRRVSVHAVYHLHRMACCRRASIVQKIGAHSLKPTVVLADAWLRSFTRAYAQHVQTGRAALPSVDTDRSDALSRTENVSAACWTWAYAGHAHSATSARSAAHSTPQHTVIVDV
jgi:hypothetical protein